MTVLPRWARPVVIAYWTLLFGAFPVAMNYPAFITGRFASVPQDTIETIPKVVVLVLCWGLGLILAIALASTSRLSISTVQRVLRSRSAWGWSLAALLTWVVVAALFVGKGLVSPWLGTTIRYDGVVFQLLWWSLVPITWSIARATVSIGRAVIVLPAVISAAVVALWSTVEAYGFEPLSWLSNQVSTVSNGNAAASMGHQALLSIYVSALGLALSTYFVSRRGDQPVSIRIATVGLLGLFWMSAFASGGRSGLYAALAGWIIFLVWRVLSYGRLRTWIGRAALVTALILLVGLANSIFNPHFQRKTEATLTGGTSFAHRLITWRLGIEAIARRPLVGYGPDNFAQQIWNFATPAQGRELLTEVVPRKYVATARRHGEAVVYVGPNHQVRMLRINYDKTHNYLIEVAFASGLPALVALLALCGFGGWQLARSGDPVARAALWGFLAAGVALQAWFYTLSLDPLIWAWFGVALGWAPAASTPSQPGEGPSTSPAA